MFVKSKTQKGQPDAYKFDGAEASVFDVKQEIMRAKKLGKGTDFDLVIVNSQTSDGEFYVRIRRAIYHDRCRVQRSYLFCATKYRDHLEEGAIFATR